MATKLSSINGEVIWKYFKYFLIFIAVIGVLGQLVPAMMVGGENNLQALQANAFLQGKLDLPKWYHDTAVYKGHYYVPFPPFPAILLLPFVALLGIANTKVVIISLLLTVLNTFLLKEILKKMDIDKKMIPWVLASFFLGTGYLLSVINSTGVWYFDHVVAVTGMFLAINEAMGKGGGILTGLFLGMAFLSRQMSIYASIFLIALLWKNTAKKDIKIRFANIAGFGLGFGVCFVLYLYLNWVRFDNMFDTGYSMLVQWGVIKHRLDKFGIFNPAFIIYNLKYLLLQGPHIEFEGTYHLYADSMDPYGTALTYASPFILFAFIAKYDKRILWSAWISIALILMHTLLYFNNGYYQTNTQRFTLDFLPIMILLAALGMKKGPEYLWKAAIIYSIALNVFSLAFFQI
jgi:4-amino-4-deoxy-L-arabinose transferase-like glycosyltransferase